MVTSWHSRSGANFIWLTMAGLLPWHRPAGLPPATWRWTEARSKDVKLMSLVWYLLLGRCTKPSQIPFVVAGCVPWANSSREQGGLNRKMMRLQNTAASGRSFACWVMESQFVSHRSSIRWAKGRLVASTVAWNGRVKLLKPSAISTFEGDHGKQLHFKLQTVFFLKVRRKVLDPESCPT